MSERIYPIEIGDIAAAEERIKQRRLDRHAEKRQAQHKKKQALIARQIAARKAPDTPRVPKKLPILSLDDAARRLNDPAVWNKVSQGFRYRDDD